MRENKRNIHWTLVSFRVVFWSFCFIKSTLIMYQAWSSMPTALFMSALYPSPFKGMRSQIHDRLLIEASWGKL